jgi:hypothetical protein
MLNPALCGWRRRELLTCRLYRVFHYGAPARVSARETLTMAFAPLKRSKTMMLAQKAGGATR